MGPQRSADDGPPESTLPADETAITSVWVRFREIATSRWVVKLAFLAMFVVSCVQLFRFAAWARGAGSFVPRPEAPAGLLPVGHFLSFFAWLRGGGWDALLPAGPVIILGALAVSLVFRRGFCGWICPVGTVWESFAALGRRILGRDFRLPRWLDIAGRGLRFLLAGAAVAILASVPLGDAVGFRTLPYMWVADLKILGLMIQPAYLLLVLCVGVVSALIGPLWCRYLCPVGGMYAVVALASPGAITRDDDKCIACGKCAATCHAYCAPNRVRTVRDTECDGCMECARVCPVDGCLEAKMLHRLRVAPWVWPLLVVGVWLAIWGVAKVSGNWDSTVPIPEFRAAIQSGLLDQSSVPAQR